MPHFERVNLIKTRLQQAFFPRYLKVIDESEEHIGHAGYGNGGRHFAIEIASSSLTNLSRVVAHRKIYDLFTDLMPNEIHALKIKIL